MSVLPEDEVADCCLALFAPHNRVMRNYLPVLRFALWSAWVVGGFAMCLPPRVV